jgi:uncharacterized membrane protein YtjA (UPF0391 family)
MPQPKKVDGLEISEDMNFQRKEWTAERWGWVFMLIVIIAALLGLFGQGPLSSASAESGVMQVRYNRFERLLAPTQLTVRLDQDSAENGEIRLQVDQSLMQAYTVENIFPDPESVEVSPNQYIYVFKTAQGGRPPDILFNLQPNRLGPASGQIGLENGQAVRLSQFIYP